MPGNAHNTYFTLEQVLQSLGNVLAREFGVLVTEHLSQEIVSRSVKDMSARLGHKQNVPAELLPCAAYAKRALQGSKGKRKAIDELGGQPPANNSMSNFK
ncbi:hypothetical protein F4604DRAFT_1936835 [Suillus subluteus]|nr:hypothetical protein F4604DRAFT_1936835 [Suillus subluteus]